MLTVTEQLPRGFLDADITELHELLPGPTLMHLSGRREPALFVSVLLHGNEDTGVRAVQGLLRSYAGQELPRALSLLVGNVGAARYQLRRLQDQPDYNRVWLAGPTPEHQMARRVFEDMARRGVFASIDIHNNTGVNPHYACVNCLEPAFLHLAALFGRTVVYFTRPEGVHAAAFAHLCPAVTLEAGQAGETYGVRHTQDYVEACLHLAEIPAHWPASHDLDLFHSVATIRVPDEVSLGIGDEEADICLIEDLDHLNFSELPPDTLLGWTRTPPGRACLAAWDEHGREVGERYFQYNGNEIRTRIAFMPSMLTLNKTIIRQDCLGYAMERHVAWAQEVLRVHPGRRGAATSPFTA